MKVLICGGSLQGVELCFLAKEADWKTYLIDKNEQCPASKLADTNICFDLTLLDSLDFNNTSTDIGDINNTNDSVLDIFHLVDLIIPATENDKALQSLTHFCKKFDLRLAFDENAYAVSSSKIASRSLFLDCKTPIPTPSFQENALSFPMIAKPSEGSGSQGVQIFQNIHEFQNAFPQGIETPLWIFEAYCDGPSYSIEICGTPKKYKTFAVTALHMDESFDCKGVSTPSGLPASEEESIAREAIKLAEELNLHGLMDLEVIWTNTGYKVLEIDARFPSQTPSAVYFATGINLAEQLAAAFIDYTPQSKTHALHAVRYEHIYCDSKNCVSLGEHIMQAHGPLEPADFCAPYPTLVGKTENSMAATFMLHCPIIQSDTQDNAHKDAQINLAALSHKFQSCLQSLQTKREGL